ncbi:MAG: hypothetical protein ACU88J_02470 [Gammaproteobacteria bacterium]
MAEYLQDKLPHYGLRVASIGVEVWGWIVELENEEFPLWIGCGHQNGKQDELLCFIEPSRPFIWRWFKKFDTRAKIGNATDALKKALESDSDIHDIRLYIK